MKRTLLSLLSLFFFLNAHAQLSNLSIDYLNVDSGLPNENVVGFLQDEFGYVWLATDNGVVRYDGYNSRIYKFAAVKGSNSMVPVNGVYQDDRKNIWVMTYHAGVFRYDRITDSFIQYHHDPKNTSSLATDNVVRIYQGAGSDLWFLHNEPGINSHLRALGLYDPQSQRFFVYGQAYKGKFHLDGGWIPGVFKDHRNNIWTAADQWLLLFDPVQKTFTKVAQMEKGAWLSQFSQTVKDNDRIWIGSSGKGLYQLDTKTHLLKQFKHQSADPASILSDTTFNVMADRQNRVWVLTQKGLSLKNGDADHFTNYPFTAIKNLVKSFTPRRLRQDDQGNFWIPGFGALVYFNVQTGQYSYYPAQQENPSGMHQISDVFTDRSHVTWFSTFDNGIGRLNPLRSATRVYDLQPKLGDENVVSILKNSPNTCYLGATGSGNVYFYDLRTGQMTTAARSDNEYNYSFLRLRNNNIVFWFNKLVIFNPETHKTMVYEPNQPGPKSFKSNFIYTVLQDKTGNLWIGTSGGGLCFFNTQTQEFKNLPFSDPAGKADKPDPHKLSDKLAFSLLQDKAGTIWIGTIAGGLNRLNVKDTTFTVFQAKDQLLNMVSLMFEDSKGQFWLGTEFDGLLLFDRKSGKVIRHITEKDGLVGYTADIDHLIPAECDH